LRLRTGCTALATLCALVLPGCRFETSKQVGGQEYVLLRSRHGERVGGFTLLLLEGAPYDRGLEHGRTMAPEIQASLGRWRLWLEHETGARADALVARVLAENRWLEAAERETPELLDELRGIADGAGVDLETLFAFNASAELFAAGTRTEVTTGSDLALWGRAGRPNLIAGNDDLPTFFGDSHVMLAIRGEDTDLAVYSYAGLLGRAGVNSSGLGVSMRSAGNEREVGPDTLPAPFLLRRVLLETELRAAVEVIEQRDPAVLAWFLVGDETGLELVPEDAPALAGAEDEAGARGLASALIARSSEDVAELLGLSAQGVKGLLRRSPVLHLPGDPFSQTMASYVIELRDPAPAIHKDERGEVATFGAGCYWCVEAVLLTVDGVLSVESGFMGGHVPNPSYRDACSGTTGHAEVVQVRFDPEVVSYEELLEWFWRLHDPTTLNRQGADVGTQYRSAIFFHDEAQRAAAEASRAAADRSGAFAGPIVTELAPAAEFYPAPEEHRDYYRRNSEAGYCRMVIAPKLHKLGISSLDRS
jgi:peptide-methionine (S)-S-oxide reductase